MRSWVISLNGSISVVEPIRPFQTGVPAYCAAADFGMDWAVYLFQIAVDSMILPISRGSGIVYDRKGILTTTEPDRMLGEVVSVMTHLCDLSSIIKLAQDMFREFEYVRDVKASEIEPGHTAVLSVFVWMPSYDYDKMMELARVQRRVEQVARKHGCEIEAMFLPLPHVDPEVQITVRPSTYLE